MIGTGACKDQKRALGSLEPELQKAMNHMLCVLGNERPIARAVHSLNCRIISPGFILSLHPRAESTMMGEVKATGTCSTRPHSIHKQEIGMNAIYCSIHSVHFAQLRIAVQGRDPPTVGESSHLSWLHQDNGPMYVQRPIFQVSVDFVKLTVNTNCRFLHALICPSAPLLVPFALLVLILSCHR